MNNIQRITSFSVDHDRLTPGIYISRVDGDITTFDLRNSEIADRVIYFGPMGCRTGFYLLTRDVEPETVLAVVKDTLARIIAHDGGMFGAEKKECGNYLDLNLEDAKRECAAYLDVLNSQKEITFRYE